MPLLEVTTSWRFSVFFLTYQQCWIPLSFLSILTCFASLVYVTLLFPESLCTMLEDSMQSLLCPAPTRSVNVGWDFPQLSMGICAFSSPSTHFLLLAELYPYAHNPNLHFQPRSFFCTPPWVLWDKAGLVSRARSLSLNLLSFLKTLILEKDVNISPSPLPHT